MFKNALCLLVRHVIGKKSKSAHGSLKKAMGVITRSFFTSTSTHVHRVINSKFGNVEIPNLSLPEFIWKEHENWIDLPAITCSLTGRSYTFGEVRQLAQRMAKALLTIGLKPGDVIGLILPNIPEYIIMCHGAIEAGVVITTANPLYTPGEIKSQFSNCDAKLIVCVGPLFQQAKDVGKTNKNFMGLIVIGAEEFNVECDEKTVFNFSTLLMNADDSLELPKLDPSALAALPYSSGTTGVPKGVMITHKNLVSNVSQLLHPLLMGANETTENYQEKVFSILPFFHIYGFTILNICLSVGVHIVTMPKFIPDIYIETLVKYKPHTIFVVPSLLNLLASHSAVTREHLASIQQIVSGAAPATHALIDKFRLKVGEANVRIRQGYGMTESSPVTLLTPIDMPASKHGSCGVLIPNTKARIMDVAKEIFLGPNEPGELQIKGPQVMLGYFKNEDATKITLDSKGWLLTGDVGYYDEDEYFFIVDRTKELIKVKGNQVSPTELENVIRKLPGVADVAVVGVPDELAGEVPRAFVVCHPGETSLTEQIIKDFVHPQVARYKYLEGGVRFIKEIPRNVSGKILRNELKIYGGTFKSSCPDKKK